MYDQGMRKNAELKEKVKILQRDKTKEEGTCDAEDLAMGEGGVQAN